MKSVLLTMVCLFCLDIHLHIIYVKSVGLWVGQPCFTHRFIFLQCISLLYFHHSGPMH